MCTEPRLGYHRTLPNRPSIKTCTRQMNEVEHTHCGQSWASSALEASPLSHCPTPPWLILLPPSQDQVTSTSSASAHPSASRQLRPGAPGPFSLGSVPWAGCVPSIFIQITLLQLGRASEGHMSSLLYQNQLPTAPPPAHPRRKVVSPFLHFTTGIPYSERLPLGFGPPVKKSVRPWLNRNRLPGARTPRDPSVTNLIQKVPF